MKILSILFSILCVHSLMAQTHNTNCVNCHMNKNYKELTTNTDNCRCEVCASREKKENEARLNEDLRRNEASLKEEQKKALEEAKKREDEKKQEDAKKQTTKSSVTASQNQEPSKEPEKPKQPVIAKKNTLDCAGEFSDWLFIQSDNALQFRMRRVKDIGDTSEFEVQFRINFEDPIFCSHPDCKGYVLAFGVPSLDRKQTIFYHYKFYNSFKGIYTMPVNIKVQMNFPDGYYRFLTKKDGFMYSSSTGDKTGFFELFYNCVDQINTNPNVSNRCGPGGYRNIFIESKAVVVQ